MNLTIVNSFSLNMLDESVLSIDLHIERVNIKLARMIIQCAMQYGTLNNCIGHKTSDELIRNRLCFGDFDMMENWPKRKRATVKFEEHLLVGQYKGPRLKEGTIALPSNAKIIFWEITHK